MQQETPTQELKALPIPQTTLTRLRDLKVENPSDKWLLDLIVKTGVATAAQWTWLRSLIEREGRAFKADAA